MPICRRPGAGCSTGSIRCAPGQPPDPKSALWARDTNEVKALGARTGSQRTAEQTEIARFWTATTPSIHFPIARCVANQPGREVTQNARLLAVSGQAMVDAIDTVFDAKYEYHFWRPFTAIRNGDQDGNDATAVQHQPDLAWRHPFMGQRRRLDAGGHQPPHR